MAPLQNSIRTKKNRQNLYLFRNAPDGGINTNLLLLLHGSGDSHRPFDKLAQTMSLPQTATLSINSRVCGIDLPFGLGSSWFQEMDYTTGNPLPRNHVTREQTPERTVDFMAELIQRLTTSWVPERVFMLGYGAGASVAVETCRLWTGRRSEEPFALAWTVWVALQQYPRASVRGTPILLLSHDKKLLDECTSKYEAQRGKDLVRIYVQANKGMISGPKEMEAVMKFLSERLVLAAQLPQQATEVS
jgi:predicted esterase